MKSWIWLLCCAAIALLPASAAAQGDYDPEQRLQELGYELTPMRRPAASLVPAVRAGNLLFLSGTGPYGPDGKLVTGKLGQDLSLEEGVAAARLTALRQLSVLKAELGDLRRVKRIVKVFGMVNCAPDFIQQPTVINGFSDVMIAVFGERGQHARSAVGMVSLPMGMAVEIEMIVEVED